MSWDVKYTDEFESWWEGLAASAQYDISASVRQLETRGPQLPFPHSSGLHGSRYGHMRELRIQSAGKPIRIFYAFDPQRTAILLIGGDKTGNARFYQQWIPVADKLYDVYLAELEKER